MTLIVPFLLDERAFRKGIQHWLSFDFSIGVNRHLLLGGLSGSGKTTLLRILLARACFFFAKNGRPLILSIIDPKNDSDFDFLDGLPNIYRGEDAPKGLDAVYNSFKARQSKIDTSRVLHIAVIDEAAAIFQLIEDKKQRDNAMRQFMLLTLLSRSFEFAIFAVAQQPSAASLGSSGVRDQFGNLCLLSEAGSETLNMMFDSGARETIKAFGSVGNRAGWYMSARGVLSPVRVPHIEEMQKVNQHLIKQIGGQ